MSVELFNSYLSDENYECSLFWRTSRFMRPLAKHVVFVCTSKVFVNIDKGIRTPLSYYSALHHPLSIPLYFAAP